MVIPSEEKIKHKENVVLNQLSAILKNYVYHRITDKIPRILK